MSNIPYVTDIFIDEYKTNFDMDYLSLYNTQDEKAIQKIFEREDVIIKSSKTFDFKPLLINDDTDATLENIKILRESLKSLTPVEAENEKVWIALTNTYYLDYHLYQIKDIKPEQIKGRTIFTHSNKRSLMMQNLSILWWIGYYTYDESSVDSYKYTEYFLRGAYRGNALVYLSSNIVSNKEIVIGTLQAIKQLEEDGKMITNRYSFTNSNKILNQLGGVRIIDTLSRNEVKEILLEHLIDTDKLIIPPSKVLV